MIWSMGVSSKIRCAAAFCTRYSGASCIGIMLLKLLGGITCSGAPGEVWYAVRCQQVSVNCR